MQTPDEMIAAIEAFKRDGKIQYRSAQTLGGWMHNGDPCWDFLRYEYRPVPKPKEIWVNEYSGALMYAYKSKENALGSAKSTPIHKAVRYIEADPE